MTNDAHIAGITSVGPVSVDAELDRLAGLYRNAGGAGMQVLSMLGTRAEGLLDRLPASVRDNLDQATETALRIALRAASGSRMAVADQPAWLNTAVTTAMGAAGGMGGLPSALVELPVTTTVLLRAIQGVAAENGFDPDTDSVRFDCVRVFAAAGPLKEDDGADLSFLLMRLSLARGGVERLVAAVVPRLAGVLGQKLAAQAVPLLGAVAGAATNYAYTSYYQNMAQVHFGLRRLSIDADVERDELVRRLAARLER